MKIVVIILTVIGLIIINYGAVRDIRRLLSVKKRKASVEGKIIDFDNRNVLTVEYNANGSAYKEKCSVMFTRPFSSNIMKDDELIQYSLGDIVSVDYDKENPKCFLIPGGETFYKFRIALIFFANLGVLFIASILCYMVYLTEIGILK